MHLIFNRLITQCFFIYSMLYYLYIAADLWLCGMSTQIFAYSHRFFFHQSSLFCMYIFWRGDNFLHLFVFLCRSCYTKCDCIWWDREQQCRQVCRLKQQNPGGCSDSGECLGKYGMNQLGQGWGNRWIDRALRPTIFFLCRISNQRNCI